MKKMYLGIWLALCPLLCYAHGSGTITNLLVGRLGYQVMVTISGSVDPAPCRTQSSFHYYLDMNTPGAKDILSALLTARATGQHIFIVSTGTCDTTGQGVELISYVMLN